MHRAADRRSERRRIARRAHEHRAFKHEGHLDHWQVGLRDSLAIETILPHVSGDADNRVPRLDAIESDPAANRIVAVPITRHALADNHNRRRLSGIGQAELTAANDWYAERTEIVIAHDGGVRGGPLATCRRSAFDLEGTRKRAELGAERHQAANRSRLHAGQTFQLLPQRWVEAQRVFRGLVAREIAVGLG